MATQTPCRSRSRAPRRLGLREALNSRYLGRAGGRQQVGAPEPVPPRWCAVAERVLGPDHPDTLAARANLAAWTGQAGDAAAARVHRSRRCCRSPASASSVRSTPEQRLGQPPQPGYLRRVTPGPRPPPGTSSPCAPAPRPRALDLRRGTPPIPWWPGSTWPTGPGLHQGRGRTPGTSSPTLLPVRERIVWRGGPPRHLGRAGRSLRTWTGCAGGGKPPPGPVRRAAAMSYERILGPEHADTLAVWYQLAHWTALAGDEAGAQD